MKGVNVLIDGILEVRRLSPLPNIARRATEQSSLDPNPHQIDDLREVENC